MAASWDADKGETRLRYHLRVRLLLLSARPDLRTNTRMADAARDLEIDLQLLDAITVSALLADGHLRPLGIDAGGTLPNAVLARIGNWRPESLLAVLEAVVALGVATPNPPSAIRLGRDHWATVTTLSAAGLPVPPTVAGADPVHAEGLEQPPHLRQAPRPYGMRRGDQRLAQRHGALTEAS